jgi:nucleotide-binding universal stress UspA family protein
MVHYKKFLIPVDFSDHSELAAKRGLSLAQMYQGSVYFLHVGEHAQRSATRLSKFISHRIGFELSVPAKKLVAQGSPPSTILSAARKIGADAIVMGSRGVSGLKHLVQGSVAEKVLRQSERPVFIIKQRKRVDTGE